MPKRIPNWKPPGRTRPAETRPSSHARGYGSKSWQMTRLAVIARDMGICQMCGIIVRQMAQIDHIKEKAAGGSDDMSNLRLL
jgi:5-methylcytosine-specific restriction protein A